MRRAMIDSGSKLRFVVGALCGALILSAGAGAHAQPAAKPAKETKKAAAGKPSPQAAPAGPATSPADSSPMADLKKSNAALKKVLQKQSPNWSPEKDAKTSEVRKV